MIKKTLSFLLLLLAAIGVCYMAVPSALCLTVRTVEQGVDKVSPPDVTLRTLI